MFVILLKIGNWQCSCNCLAPGMSASSKTSGSSNEHMLREPAQATKLAALDSSADGLPKEGSNGLPGPGREPEMGQEPAGPDQSLPISSEPGSVQQPPIPRERTATSYINVSV